MSIGIIVQARNGSTRLPNKVNLKIGGKKILEHVIDRLNLVSFKKKIIIATTKNRRDNNISKIAKKKNCLVYKGSENNVLSRYYHSSKRFKLKIIVRICSDSPFIDPKIIDKAFKIYYKKKTDYVSNIIKPSYPAGMSVEIFNFKSLKKCMSAKTDIKEKQHVTPYIYRNKTKFALKNFRSNKKYGSYRFAVDYKKDLIALKKIYESIPPRKKENYSLEDLIKIVDKNPKIKKINSELSTILRY